MSITVICPGCKKQFSVSDKFAGMTGPCKYCKTPITIPKLDEQVVIHGGQAFSSGGKDASGKLILKPLTRNRSKFNVRLAVGIAVGTLVVLIASLVLGHIIDLNKNWLVASIALTVVTPVLVAGLYPSLKSDEMLGTLSGFDLYWRTAAVSAAYLGIWGAIAFLMTIGSLNNQDPILWMVLIPVLIVFGAFMSMCFYELTWSNAFCHVLFYVMVTLFLRYWTGIIWFTEYVTDFSFGSGAGAPPPPPVP